jgi:phage terminase large subunit
MDIEVYLDTTSSFDIHAEAADSSCFFIVSQGGARSGKTYSILQNLLLKALKNTGAGLIISVVAETYPVLKRGAIRDFESILRTANLWDDRNWNKSDAIYTLYGNTIEFFSVEKSERAKGPARDYLFINEANNVSYETAFQLIARTSKQTYIDFNPVHEFWVHDQIMNASSYAGDWKFLKTTYLDNELLEESIKKNLLARAKKDENFKRVYILGEIGLSEGLIFPNFKTITEIPDEVYARARRMYYSLDWGYSGDPAAICEVYILGSRMTPVESVYVSEVLYDTGFRNSQLKEHIDYSLETRTHSLPYLVVADSSEPKSIDELALMKVPIIGAEKPAGSVNYGIEILQGADIYITTKSLNVIKEFRNYKWATDRNGKPIRDGKGRPQPVDLWNHAIDGIRYVAYTENNEKFSYRPVPRQKSSGMIPV